MNKNNQIQLKITDDDLKARYANNMRAAFTADEFMLDFQNIFPPVGITTARLIISPGHLKRINLYLEKLLKEYEKQHGTLTESTTPVANAKIGFSTED